MPTIDEAKNIIKETPITGIVGTYISLNKKGANYQGICPFHADTKPSLMINDAKGLYKCFACGAAGDAIKFVEDYLSMNFVDAVKDIASKLGISIENKYEKNQNPKMDMAIRILTVANKIYVKYAKELAQKDFNEFAKKRNLSKAAIDDFSLGLAPPDSALTKYLHSLSNAQERDFALKVALEIGILRKSKHGAGEYDFFRDRVTFPIMDHFGKVRGFSTRAIREDQKPKYLNSGESFVFNKGSILYGHHIAKRVMREEDMAIIVEGNMDTVVMHQFGFKTAVATMGTAFNEGHVQLLSQITKNIYLGMDNDLAGEEAAKKVNNFFLKAGIVPKVLNFAPSKDPDDYLNAHGGLALKKQLLEPKSFIDYQKEVLLANSSHLSVDEKVQKLHAFYALVAPLKENLVAIEQVISFGKLLGLNSSAEDLRQSYKDFLSDALKVSDLKPKRKPTPEAPAAQKETAVSTEKLVNEHRVLTKTQKKVLQEIIAHPQLLSREEIVEILDFIGDDEVKQFIGWLKEIYLEVEDSDYINVVKTKLESDMNPNFKNIIAEALFKFEAMNLPEKILSKLARDLKLTLHKEQFKMKRSKLISAQKNCQAPEENERILNRIAELDKEYNQFSKTFLEK